MNKHLFNMWLCLEAVNMKNISNILLLIISLLFIVTGMAIIPILGIVHIANHLAHLDTLVFLVFPLCDLGVNGAILIIGDHNSKRIRGKRLIRQAGSGICRAFCH